MTQHEKIIEMCLDGNWHCQNEFRALYIFSPHKRRSEIEAQGKYKFEWRKCEHDIRGQRDYRMVEPTELELDEYKHIDCFDCWTDPISLSEQKLNL